MAGAYMPDAGATAAPQLGTAGPAAVQAYLAALRAAGLQASTNLQDLNGPGVLITAPVLHWKLGTCRRAEWTFYVVAGATGRGQALTALFTAVATAMAALNYPSEVATPDTLQTPSGALLPAYLLQFTTEL
jgi:hypothetical protein